MSSPSSSSMLPVAIMSSLLTFIAVGVFQKVSKSDTSKTERVSVPSFKQRVESARTPKEKLIAQVNSGNPALCQAALRQLKRNY